MPGITLPPFPKDVPSHPLLVIDYELLQANNQQEIDRLWEAATKLGFWYLKNHGADDDAEKMFEMGAETMALPMEEKMRFEQGDGGMSFGYKAAGANAVDASGQPDSVEFINVSKDDALAYPEVARRSYPSAVNARMENTIRPFIQKSLDVNYTILDIFNRKLGLPQGALRKLHQEKELSASETRVVKTPPHMQTKGQLIGSHTDFGTLLGGLQVLPPHSEDWQYVKPIPGHAICNVGDALSIFSGGILRSNLHRVVAPPGDQAAFERWSLVFFTRPGNDVVLRALMEDSPLISEAVKSKPDQKFETGSTASEWFSRRIKYQRLKNREGPETWMASRGTEADPTV